MVSHTLSCEIDLPHLILHIQTPSTTPASFLQDFAHNFVGTVNAFQWFQPQPIPDVAFPTDVLENK